MSRTLKYDNRRTNGFDSASEAARYQELALLEKAGKIFDLKTQVRFELIPPQMGKDGKVIERAVTYVADFTYQNKDGTFTVEDRKGYKTVDYIIKRKLMLWVRGIKVAETAQKSRQKKSRAVPVRANRLGAA